MIYSKRFHHSFSFFLTALLLCSSPLFFLNNQAFGAPLTGKITYTPEYRVSVGDSLSVDVLYAPEFKQDNIPVRSDGTATFKAIGQINVADRSLSEVNNLVKEALKELIREPIVTVSVGKSQSRSVFLLGSFQKPGMYEVSSGSGDATTNSVTRSNFTLTNVISNAGGVSANADISSIQVERKHSGEVITVDYWKVLENGDYTQDVVIQSGDSIRVPELPRMSLDDESFEKLLKSPIGPKSIPVRVIGELTTPGTYELTSDSPYLMTAVAKAGGYEDSARVKEIEIRRMTNDNEFKTFKINPNNYDWVLRPNDVVFVNKTKMAKAAVKGRQVDDSTGPIQNTMSSIVSSLFFFGR